MDESLLYFVLGTLASIPIAIFSPFATSRIQRRIARATGRISTRRRSSLMRELEIAESLHNDFSRYTTFALSRFLLITLLSVVFGIIPSGLFGVASLYLASSTNAQGYANGTNHYAIGMVIESSASLVEIVGAAVVAQLCMRTLRLMNNTRNFPAFRAQLAEQLPEFRARSLGNERFHDAMGHNHDLANASTVSYPFAHVQSNSDSDKHRNMGPLHRPSH